MLNRVLYVVYIVYCFEVGAFLLVFPWLRIWEYNALLEQAPHLKAVLLNNFVRGGVSGLGLVNLIIGAWEVFHFGRNVRRIS
ncbi:MAG: hypothetical protein ACR2L2_08095 [Acidobacteriota bacterium]